MDELELSYKEHGKYKVKNFKFSKYREKMTSSVPRMKRRQKGGRYSIVIY
jgi:hypothetical protein